MKNERPTPERGITVRNELVFTTSFGFAGLDYFIDLNVNPAQCNLTFNEIEQLLNIACKLGSDVIQSHLTRISERRKLLDQLENTTNQ